MSSPQGGRNKHIFPNSLSISPVILYWYFFLYAQNFRNISMLINPKFDLTSTATYFPRIKTILLRPLCIVTLLNPQHLEFLLWNKRLTLEWWYMYVRPTVQLIASYPPSTIITGYLETSHILATIGVVERARFCIGYGIVIHLGRNDGGWRGPGWGPGRMKIMAIDEDVFLLRKWYTRLNGRILL